MKKSLFYFLLFSFMSSINIVYAEEKAFHDFFDLKVDQDITMVQLGEHFQKPDLNLDQENYITREQEKAIKFLKRIDIKPGTWLVRYSSMMFKKQQERGNFPQGLSNEFYALSAKIHDGKIIHLLFFKKNNHTWATARFDAKGNKWIINEEHKNLKDVLIKIIQNYNLVINYLNPSYSLTADESDSDCELSHHQVLNKQ